MVLWNPALIEGAGTRGGGEGRRDGFGARERIGIGIGGERLAAGLGTGGLGALGLGEESLNPGLVDEVQNSTEGGREEDVEEDANESVSTTGRYSAKFRGHKTYI